MKIAGKKSVFLVLTLLFVMMFSVVPVSAKAHKHNWGKWIVKTSATCKSTGVKKRYCKVKGCKACETKSIPVDKNKHIWVAANSKTAPYAKATCTSNGFGYRRRCSLCNKPIDRYVIKKLGHSYKKGVCTRCKKHK